jgi:hypothetical protein
MEMSVTKNFDIMNIKVVKIDTMHQIYINHHVNIMFDTLVYQSTNQCWPKLQNFFVSKFNLQIFFWNEILVANKGSRQNAFDPPRHKNYQDGNWNSIIAIWQTIF